ncbi:hypothetical protein TgHK011_008866 [Trichoderma gracile]|nr:hypothetical protein TgHK011_008866 [Trichoderma gracile]
MSNSLDIQNMLQTGYFTTSRAKHGYSASTGSAMHSMRSSESPEPPVSRLAPRYYDDIPYRRRLSLPSPTVEDEAESLAKEFRGRVELVAEEEPQSRGEIDQQPLMLEVHEYNLERRFVIVPGSSKPSSSESVTEDGASREKLRQEKEKKKEKRKAPASPPPEAHTRTSNEPAKADSDRLNGTVPKLEKRGSRQELPRLETDVNEGRVPSHHRSKSAASAPRPEFTQAYRKYGEEYLSPQVTKHGPSGRDKTYHHAPTQSSVSLSEADEKRRDDDKYHRRSATVSMEGRPNSSFEPFRKPMANDRINGPRPLDGSRPARDDLRDGSYSAYRPSPVESLRAPSPSKFKDQNSPRDEAFSASYRREPVIVDDDRMSVASSRRGDGKGQHSRSPSRAPTMPTMPVAPELPEDWVPNRRLSTTFPISRDNRSPPTLNLPYPDDDDAIVAWPETEGDAVRQSQASSASSSIVMPAIPRVDDELVAPDDRSVRSSTPRDSSTAKPWQPPPFDPSKSGVRPDLTVGSYRRYSETKGRDGQSDLPIIPECKRTEPVAGKMDWLTLPRTDFNICPDCYGAVFADTQFRTHFHPVLRPTGTPIACDFAVSLSSKRHDPYTRRPIPEFAPTRNVCSLHFTPQRKQFVLFFDAFETTSDKGYVTNRKPDIGELSMMLTRLSTLDECREDRRVSDGYWYVMEYLPEFTVCGECYEDVVRPLRLEDNVIAQNFYPKPTKLPIATCQLYSPRMRDVFRRACRNKDPEYLEAKVRERLKVERDLHAKFLDLVRDKRGGTRTEDQIDKLSREVSAHQIWWKENSVKFIAGPETFHLPIAKFDLPDDHGPSPPFTMASRPTVSIIGKDGAPSGATHTIPAVFASPIRPDIVKQVHTGMAKNKRQPYAVSEKAGHQTSAESWGTGRAVARIPRVSGSGTHRAGQAAFGNMCRSGRMFAPTKIWRKWHVKVNQGQKRYATCSALAASASAPLLLARGHQVMTIPEVPLVVDSALVEGSSVARTSAALALLKAVGAGADLEKVKGSKKLRAGKGKLRNRRHRQRRGPLVVYNPEVDGKELVKGFRNIPGVETSPVSALNLLQLAPGGHLGRFVIWTSAAFKALDEIYGSTTVPSAHKKDFLLPSNVVSQADLTRLINSSEIQSSLNAPKGDAVTRRSAVQKKNPLRNKQVLLRLNPYAKVFAEESQKKQA